MLQKENDMRIGHGFDVHRFTPNKPLILGGVPIPYNQGLLAHSDGDVVLHAICDALLGAAALGDIGRHFSDKDSQYLNVDSRLLLRQVVEMVNKKGLKIQNLDVTIIAESPKLAGYIDVMRQTIAKDTGLLCDCVNLKATTMEKLGPIGAGEGIEVHAVTLLL